MVETRHVATISQLEMVTHVSLVITPDNSGASTVTDEVHGQRPTPFHPILKVFSRTPLMLVRIVSIKVSGNSLVL